MKKILTVLLVVGGLLCMRVSGLFHERLIEARTAHRLSAMEPIENAPALVTFNTIVLGGFRGLIADLLWLRVSALQDQGRYVELVQLSDWITKLEPRYTDVWAYHAWNMAYNVSIMMGNPADRWRWVRNGIDLLRDEGIRYNPEDPNIYVELGWLYQHKIAGLSDRANGYYKRALAQQVETAIGGAHPDYEALKADPVRAQRIRKELKLDPAVMQQVDDRYGPLDWRRAETHAIYWAFCGTQEAGLEGCWRCDRMIVQNLVSLFVRGDRGLDLDLLPVILRAYEDDEKRYGDLVGTAYANFLTGAILWLDRAGHKDRARELYGRLRGRLGTGQEGISYEDFVTELKRRVGE